MKSLTETEIYSYCLYRHSLCSVQRENCRREKRWSTQCPSMRLTSSTAVHRASWLSSPETPERSSLKSVSRLMLKCVSGGKKARQRSFQGYVEVGLQECDCFTLCLCDCIRLIFPVFGFRYYLLMKSICWTWSVFLSWTVPWRVICPQFLLWQLTEASLGTVFFYYISCNITLWMDITIYTCLTCMLPLFLSVSVAQTIRALMASPSICWTACSSSPPPLILKKRRGRSLRYGENVLWSSACKACFFVPRRDIKTVCVVFILGVRRRMWSWVKRPTLYWLVLEWRRHSAMPSSLSALQDWCVANARWAQFE